MSNEHIYICELYTRTGLFVSKYTNTTMLELICTITIASSSSSSTVMTLEHCKQLLASYAIQTHRPLLDIHHLACGLESVSSLVPLTSSCPLFSQFTSCCTYHFITVLLSLHSHSVFFSIFSFCHYVC